VAQDLLFERAERRRRLETELVERCACVAVGGEGVGLPVRAIEGQHLLGAEPFAVGMREDERLELGGDGRVAAFGEVELDARLEGGEAGLVEAGGLGLRERLVHDVRDCGPSPERERVVQLARGDQPLEPVDVALVRLDADEVPGRTRHDPVGADRASKGVDVHLERVLRARGRRFAPDPVDQAVGRDGRVRREQQPSQQRTRPRAAERHGDAIVVEHLQRPQQAEFHALSPLPRLLKRSLGGS
jgi:hypothetical protein